jgi:formylglycine-generating enzyme required for sulfatase activity
MTEEIKQCYRALDLEPGATPAEVKVAWRELVKVWHPDRFPNDAKLKAKGAAKLRDINRAYETLEAHLRAQQPSQNRSTENRGQQTSGEYRPGPPPKERKESQSKKPSKAFAIYIAAMIFGVLVIGLDMLRVSLAEKREVEGQQAVAIKATRASEEVERLRLVATLEQQKEDEAAKVQKQKQELVEVSHRLATLEWQAARAAEKAADDAKLLAAAQERERQRMAADESNLLAKSQERERQRIAAAEANLLAKSQARDRQRIAADEASAKSLVPIEMVFINAGRFTMGDSKNEGRAEERPTRAVTLSAFYLQSTEVTYAQWKEIFDWNSSGRRGYDFPSGQRGSVGASPYVALADTAVNNTHPVSEVSWYEIVKWCNAKSEKEGLTPVYYTNDAQTTVYRSGSVDGTAPQVNWSANGYRLPTEAEWEYAARGGLAGKSYPWGDGIALTQANYHSGGDHRGTTPVGYYNGRQTPAGVDMKNGYGLYGMAGNVSEWTWDKYGSYPAAAQTDPRGPAWGSNRVVRGGDWTEDAGRVRSASRHRHYYPGSGYRNVGFRPARSSVP